MQARKSVPSAQAARLPVSALSALGMLVLAAALGGNAQAAGGQDQQSAGASKQEGLSASGPGGAMGTGPANAGKIQMSRADQKILRELTQSNLAEIQASQVALQRSQNREVREFAQRMIDEHTRMQQQVSQLADAHGVQLPAEPTPDKQELVERLVLLEGEQFDRLYRREVAEKAHRATHERLQQARESAQSPQLRDLIAQALPVVGRHLDMARGIDTGSGAASSGGAGGAADAGDGTSTTQRPQLPSGAGSGAREPVGSAAPAGASGASMIPESATGLGSGNQQQDGAGQSGVESVSGTSAPATNKRGPGKPQ